ncbi:MAG: threonylcarbamoyl-AMP synthase [Deltaproteobacteria bacterium]|nr:threonylcarbamoyl-AMP synthase [Deltaproteobacteria bacterium]
MKTEVLRVDPQRPEPELVARAVTLLERGDLVVLPTETVYGLAALGDDAVAASRIFEAKGRPAYNPLIVHVAEARDARALAASWPAAADALATLWPGPLTLVVPREPSRIPDVVAGNGPTVAFRVPAHPVTLAILKALGRPLAAPSANRFQALSPTTAAHARKTLDGRVALILDAGPCAHGIESTVVDCSSEPPSLLRPGALPLGALRERAPTLTTRSIHAIDDREPLPSPGMLARHYAPRTRLVVVRPDAVHDALRELGPRAALVTRIPRHREAPRGATLVARLPDDAPGYGASLYATLHHLDEAGLDAIVVEAVPEDDAWLAVRDRLGRAGS